jgi:hypothetical protein
MKRGESHPKVGFFKPQNTQRDREKRKSKIKKRKTTPKIVMYSFFSSAGFEKEGI